MLPTPVRKVDFFVGDTVRIRGNKQIKFAMDVLMLKSIDVAADAVMLIGKSTYTITYIDFTLGYYEPSNNEHTVKIKLSVPKELTGFTLADKWFSAYWFERVLDVPDPVSTIPAYVPKSWDYPEDDYSEPTLVYTGPVCIHCGQPVKRNDGTGKEKNFIGHWIHDRPVSVFDGGNRFGCIVINVEKHLRRDLKRGEFFLALADTQAATIKPEVLQKAKGTITVNTVNLFPESTKRRFRED
jgi:hypothetical protein